MPHPPRQARPRPTLGETIPNQPERLPLPTLSPGQFRTKPLGMKTKTTMHDTPRTDALFAQFGPVLHPAVMAYNSLSRELEREHAKVHAALAKALPVLEENAESERSFWGAGDKHKLAAEAEAIYAEAKAALQP